MATSGSTIKQGRFMADTKERIFQTDILKASTPNGWYLIFGMLQFLF
jgi:hypothetical protein